MKGRNLLITSLIVFIAAVLLIVINNSIKSQDFVIIGGILFIWAGFFNLLIFEVDRRRATVARSQLAIAFSWIASGAAIILGLIMLFCSSVFVGFVPYLFAFLLLCGTIYHVFILAYYSRPAKMPAWLYVFPAAMLGGAVYLLTLTPGEDSDPKIMLATGIALALFGVVGTIESVIFMRYQRAVSAGNTAVVSSASSSSSSAPQPLDATND